MEQRPRRLLIAFLAATLLSAIPQSATVRAPCCEFCALDLQNCLSGCATQDCRDACQQEYLTCAMACVNCNHWCGGPSGECYQFGCAWPLQCDGETGCCVLPGR